MAQRVVAERLGLWVVLPLSEPQFSDLLNGHNGHPTSGGSGEGSMTRCGSSAQKGTGLRRGRRASVLLYRPESQGPWQQWPPWALLSGLGLHRDGRWDGVCREEPARSEGGCGWNPLLSRVPWAGVFVLADEWPGGGHGSPPEARRVAGVPSFTPWALCWHGG